MRRHAVTGWLAVGLVLAGCGGGDRAARCDDFRFDRDVWSLASSSRGMPGQTTTRQDIAEDLIECGTLDGKTPRQVRALLGRATLEGEEAWFYDLGPQRELGGLDNEQLAITFDAEGRFAKARIVTF